MYCRWQRVIPPSGNECRGIPDGDAGPTYAAPSWGKVGTGIEDADNAVRFPSLHQLREFRQRTDNDSHQGITLKAGHKKRSASAGFRNSTHFRCGKAFPARSALVASSAPACEGRHDPEKDGVVSDCSTKGSCDYGWESLKSRVARATASHYNDSIQTRIHEAFYGSCQ